MPPIRQRPAPRGATSVPPSLFLIRSSERRRTWRADPHRDRSASVTEIDLRSHSMAEELSTEIFADRSG